MCVYADSDNRLTVITGLLRALRILQNLKRRLSSVINREGDWPPPLKQPPDSSAWALYSEDNAAVLARAVELGSLLVKVVTWNLQARPTPGAEVLRKLLLQPLQVCFDGR
jgi:hypothetical protein